MAFSTNPIFKKTVYVVVIASVIIGLFQLIPVWKNLTYKTPPQSVEQERVTKVEHGERLSPNTIFIDRLAIVAPIVYTDENNEEAYQRALQNGVVHFPGTAHVGQLGNFYLFGHSSDFVWKAGNYKTVFALLPKISIGDQIVVSDSEGKAYVYKVLETKVVNPNDASVLSQGEYKRKLLTLQTSYPLGTALKRFIVVAEIVDL
jgi:sortase A